MLTFGPINLFAFCLSSVLKKSRNSDLFTLIHPVSLQKDVPMDHATNMVGKNSLLEAMATSKARVVV